MRFETKNPSTKRWNIFHNDYWIEAYPDQYYVASVLKLPVQIPRLKIWLRLREEKTR